jgi:hypothetical protein
MITDMVENAGCIWIAISTARAAGDRLCKEDVGAVLVNISVWVTFNKPRQS